MKLVPLCCLMGEQGELDVPGGWDRGEGGAGGFLLEDTVTSLGPQQPRGSPCAPESVAVIPALNLKMNCQRRLAGIFLF